MEFKAILGYIVMCTSKLQREVRRDSSVGKVLTISLNSRGNPQRSRRKVVTAAHKYDLSIGAVEMAGSVEPTGCSVQPPCESQVPGETLTQKTRWMMFEEHHLR